MSFSRNVQIDALRGLLLVLMTIDHLLLWPFESWKFLHAYTYNPLGYFSAAEGFFFLSGLLSGIFAAQSSGHFLNQLPARIIKLYLVNFLCIALVMTCMWVLPTYFSPWSEYAWLSTPFLQAKLALLLSAFFLCLPPFFDILPVYCLFFMTVPSIIKMIQKDKTFLLLGLSLCLFVIGQVAPLQYLEGILKELISPVVSLGWFDIFSWQLLFTLAVCCGYLFAQQKLWPSIKSPNTAMLIGLSLFCVACFVFRHDILGFGDVFAALTDVRTLGPLRLLNFLAAALLVRVLFMRTGFLQVNILASLGKKSLPVFIYHSLLVYFLGLYFNDIKDMDLVPKISLFALSIASLWLPVVLLKTPLVRRFATFPARKVKQE